MIKLVLLILSFNVFSVDLVTDYSRLTEIRKVLSENLGTGYKFLTPIFEQKGVPSIVVQKLGGNCKTIRIYSNSIRFIKTGCANKINYTLKNNPGFKSISTLIEREDQRILLDSEEVHFSYPGVSYQFFLRDIYEAEGIKTEEFQFTVAAKSYFQIKDKRLTLIQKVDFRRAKFFYFTEALRETSQTIDLKRGDLLFANNKGQYIIFKRYQPSVFRFRFLSLNSLFPAYLETIPSKLFVNQGKSYCFMDSYLDHSPYDCEYLANKAKIKKETYLNFNLISIDLKKKSIKLL